MSAMVKETRSSENAPSRVREPALKSRLGSISEEWVRPDGTIAKRVKSGVIKRALAAAMSHSRD